jgi:hypothetical protein
MAKLNERETTTKLTWQDAKRTDIRPNICCFEASVSGGKYRVAPVVYAFAVESELYEAFFIPDGARSAADVRDIAEHLPTIDEAKIAAERDYENAKGKQL